jgi:hypothetical protein
MPTAAATRSAPQPLASELPYFAVTEATKPVVVFQGSLAIAKDLEKVLAAGSIRANLVPLPGGG